MSLLKVQYKFNLLVGSYVMVKKASLWPSLHFCKQRGAPGKKPLSSIRYFASFPHDMFSHHNLAYSVLKCQIIFGNECMLSSTWTLKYLCNLVTKVCIMHNKIRTFPAPSLHLLRSRSHHAKYLE